MTLLRISVSSAAIAARESGLRAASRALVISSCERRICDDSDTSESSASESRPRASSMLRRYCASARRCERSFIDATAAAGSSLGFST
jgi:hypothetical protein